MLGYRHQEVRRRKKVQLLLELCECENDFWPNSRHFLEVGEEALAMEGIYLYLLSREDLWQRHHALIKQIVKSFAGSVDFDSLEITVLAADRKSTW
ncbi:RNA polymerase sigma factor SigZ [Roseobacter sp. SK209-2-6]|nr:RNA polymerase sigma factor SigZ [Roseobacter sp. SK209-2-6]